MSARMKVNALNTMHTAGIFSDMTVDGPEIGTLVVIVDRAKNLPNRKTIGKQDPYCAARLGKEAKKTETDRRGGQTPRWDQELRFTVHDSADYYQLKVSVFNDDKRTDLIGENFVDLRSIIVPGGGQSDVWHNLNCKGKYAGEIRIEITYYDTRPKQEKPEKAKQLAPSTIEDGGRDSLKGPRQPKPAVKRRPLPSDPVTGAPPPASAIPDHVQTPPRGYKSPTAAPEHSQTPPRSYELAANSNEFAQNPPRNHQQPPNAVPEHVPTPNRGAPTAIPQHVQTPPRGYQSTGYVPNQSPLQSFEYNNTPPTQHSQGGYDNSQNHNVYSSTPPSSKPISQDRYETYDPYVTNDYTQSNGGSRGRYDDEDEMNDPRDAYNRHTPYELPQPEDFGSPPSPGGPPPPPPAHGGRQNSHQASPTPPTRQNSYYPPESRSPNVYDSPTKPRGHSITNYSAPKSYMAYAAPKSDDPFRKSGGSYQESPPRQHPYDSRYNSNYESMQPTVEDAPPSPSGRYRGESHSSRTEDRRYGEVPSTAPLNLSGRGGSPSGYDNAPSATTRQHSNSMGYASNNSQISLRERSQTGTVSSRNSYNTLSQPQQQNQRRRSNSHLSEVDGDYGLPPVPATLVAGMDPMIAQEISERIYDERRSSFSNQALVRTHDRYQDSSSYHQELPQQHSYSSDAMVPFVPASSSSHDERQSRYSNALVPVNKARQVSPDTRRPMRKSVSPSPGASPGRDDGRRLSGVPFGPDSYNALNPKISGSTSTQSLSARYDTDKPDPDEKIITHDGREIDPSDHIPESNYAPLLESKGPKYASQQPDRNYRGPTSNSQPSSGRKQLRVAPRPQSMAITNSSPMYMNTGPNDPMASSAGRNRLQKKANRISAMPTPHSNPLTPITSYQSNSYSSRSVPRPNTADYYPNESYAPSYGAGYRGSAGPPIPAKVPIGSMNSAPAQQNHSGSGDAWALLEEMKNIDLGSGRARRRGY
ncbi:hypothetical protein HYALB_00002074 [Hymenoscyphus albidus]|uniref:C2 domain-containing protein n=1 Tax=Hymenoscyphus albidus TaxID=595503 RepID=A0A9N9PX95_9HELO|nr:hypothetical protein HYALB_00002074 [Hymenoscyphus albidus]